MKDNDWVWWALGLGLAYYLYSSGSLASIIPTAATAVGYAPIANAAGNQFSCASGTKFTEIESQVSGSGYCS